MSGLNFEPGHTVSHFRLEKKLGEGGMGAVFLAEDLTLNRQVAIKFMSRSILSQQADSKLRESLEQRFIREARSAAAINHPNLAQIYEANFETDNWFIAMEYINGQDLIQHLSEHGGFSIDEIHNIARQTVAGLRHAWNHHKILHRDIKPHNIMLTQEQVVKIVDLGLAKPLADPDAPQNQLDLTVAGTAVGTPQYMAPEQAAGEQKLNCTVDIYALGATLYEVVTGEKAFDAKSPALIYMAQMSRDYVPISERRSDVPAALVELVERMLEPKRAVRIADYDEILECLGVQADGISMTTSAVKKSTTPNFPEYPTDHLILDRYRVTQNLGKSRAGVAYLCLDTESQMECVVKSLAPGREFPAADLPWIRTNFQKLMGMVHPNLVQIRDLRQDESSGELFVVMEKLSGCDLRQFTHRQVAEFGSVQLSTAFPLIQLITTAVDAVNKTFGQVHNDLKPESIFLVDNGRQVKLLDYGITLPAAAESGSQPAPPSRAPLESPDYMAPEKWRGEPATPQSDQYSLAVVFYEMLSRKLPFWLHDPAYEPTADEAPGGKGELRRLENMRTHVLNDPPPPLPDGPKKVSRVLRKALAKRPDQRFKDCQTFGGALIKAGRSNALTVVFLTVAAVVVLSLAAYFASHLMQAPLSQPAPPDHTVPTDPRQNETGRVDPAQQDAAEEARRQEEAENRRLAEEQRGRDEEQRLAEEEAERRRAEEEARQRQEEALRDRMKQQAAELRGAFEKRLGPLLDHPFRGDSLDAAERRAEQARAIDPDVEPRKWLAAWQTAVDELDQAESEITRREKEWVLEARKEISAVHQRVRPYESWDPRIAEAFVTYDVTAAMTREAINREDFSKARAHLKTSLAKLQDIEELVKERFTPTRGQDFTVGHAGIEMRWLKDMEIWVSTTEITNGQYRKFKPQHSSKKYEGLTMNADAQPVCWISFFDALGYCAWLNNKAKLRNMLPENFAFRLPSEEEWQVFATAGHPNRTYPWGDHWPPPHGNYGNQEVFPKTWALGEFTDPFPVTCAVEKSGRNEWGLLGICGNLWEWTTTKKDSKRAVYGGAWSSCDKRLAQLELSGNNFAEQQDKYDNIGFRILLAPEPETP